jgi:hypothetical protein
MVRKTSAVSELRRRATASGYRGFKLSRKGSDDMRRMAADNLALQSLVVRRLSRRRRPLAVARAG